MAGNRTTVSVPVGPWEFLRSLTSALRRCARRPTTKRPRRCAPSASLAAVDAIVVFDDATPLRVVEALRPDVLVKGEDYEEAEIVGATEVRSWGGRVLRAPLVSGLSTTSMLDRLTGS